MTPSTYDTPAQYLTITAYAEQLGRSRKTVVRMIEGDKLPGATKVDGTWMIPADAVPVEAPGRTTAATIVVPEAGLTPPPARTPARLEQAPAEPTPDQRVAAAGYLLSLEQAAAILGADVTPGEVASLRREGVLEGHRLNGRWRITRASIKALG